MKTWEVKFKKGSTSGNVKMDDYDTTIYETPDDYTIDMLRMKFNRDMVNRVYNNKFIRAKILITRG